MQPSLSKRAGRASEPAIVYTDEHHATGVLGNVIISFSKAEPTRVFLDSWVSQTKQLVTTYRQLGGIIVIDSDAKPPSDAIRVEINQALGALGKNLIAMAHVVEGRGFVAAAKRSALSMVALLARFPFPMRIFGDPGEAAVWLATQLQNADSMKLEPRDLAAAVEIVRQALVARVR